MNEKLSTPENLLPSFLVDILFVWNYLTSIPSLSQSNNIPSICSETESFDFYQVFSDGSVLTAIAEYFDHSYKTDSSDLSNIAKFNYYITNFNLDNKIKHSEYAKINKTITTTFSIDDFFNDSELNVYRFINSVANAIAISDQGIKMSIYNLLPQLISKLKSLQSSFKFLWKGNELPILIENDQITTKYFSIIKYEINSKASIDQIVASKLTELSSIINNNLVKNLRKVNENNFNETRFLFPSIEVQNNENIERNEILKRDLSEIDYSIEKNNTFDDISCCDSISLSNTLNKMMCTKEEVEQDNRKKEVSINVTDKSNEERSIENDNYEINNNGDRLFALENALEASENKLNAYKAQIFELTQKNKECNLQLAQKTMEIDDLKQLSNGYKTDLLEIKKELDIKKEKEKEIIKELSLKDESYVKAIELKKYIEEVFLNLIEINEIDEYDEVDEKKKVEMIYGRLLDLKDNNEAAKRLFAAELDKLSLELEEKNSKIEKLMKDNENIQLTYKNQLDTLHKEMNDETQKFKSKIEALDFELNEKKSEYKKKLESASEEIDSYKESIKKLEVEKQQLLLEKQDKKNIDYEKNIEVENDTIPALVKRLLKKSETPLNDKYNLKCEPDFSDISVIEEKNTCEIKSKEDVFKLPNDISSIEELTNDKQNKIEDGFKEDDSLPNIPDTNDFYCYCSDPSYYCSNSLCCTFCINNNNDDDANVAEKEINEMEEDLFLNFNQNTKKKEILELLEKRIKAKQTESRFKRKANEKKKKKEDSISSELNEFSKEYKSIKKDSFSTDEYYYPDDHEEEPSKNENFIKFKNEIDGICDNVIGKLNSKLDSISFTNTDTEKNSEECNDYSYTSNEEIEEQKKHLQLINKDKDNNLEYLKKIIESDNIPKNFDKFIDENCDIDVMKLLHRCHHKHIHKGKHIHLHTVYTVDNKENRIKQYSHFGTRNQQEMIEHRQKLVENSSLQSEKIFDSSDKKLDSNLDNSKIMKSKIDKKQNKSGLEDHKTYKSEYLKNNTDTNVPKNEITIDNFHENLSIKNYSLCADEELNKDKTNNNKAMEESYENCTKTKKQLKSVESVIRALESNLMILKLEKDKQKEKIEAYIKENKDLKQELNLCQLKIEDLELQNNEKDDELIELTKKVENKEKLVDLKVEENQYQNDYITKLMNNIQEIQKELDIKTHAITTLTEAVEQKDQIITQMNAEKKSNTELMKKLQKESDTNMEMLDITVNKLRQNEFVFPEYMTFEEISFYVANSDTEMQKKYKSFIQDIKNKYNFNEADWKTYTKDQLNNELKNDGEFMTSIPSPVIGKQANFKDKLHLNIDQPQKQPLSSSILLSPRTLVSPRANNKSQFVQRNSLINNSNNSNNTKKIINDEIDYYSQNNKKITSSESNEKFVYACQKCGRIATTEDLNKLKESLRKEFLNEFLLGTSRDFFNNHTVNEFKQEESIVESILTTDNLITKRKKPIITKEIGVNTEINNDVKIIDSNNNMEQNKKIQTYTMEIIAMIQTINNVFKQNSLHLRNLPIGIKNKHLDNEIKCYANENTKSIILAFTNVFSELKVYIDELVSQLIFVIKNKKIDQNKPSVIQKQKIQIFSPKEDIKKNLVSKQPDDKIRTIKNSSNVLPIKKSEVKSDIIIEPNKPNLINQKVESTPIKKQEDEFTLMLKDIISKNSTPVQNQAYIDIKLNTKLEKEKQTELNEEKQKHERNLLEIKERMNSLTIKSEMIRKNTTNTYLFQNENISTPTIQNVTVAVLKKPPPIIKQTKSTQLRLDSLRKHNNKLEETPIQKQDRPLKSTMSLFTSPLYNEKNQNKIPGYDNNRKLYTSEEDRQQKLNRATLLYAKLKQNKEVKN